MSAAHDFKPRDLALPLADRSGRLVKTMRICGSGVYNYLASEVEDLIDTEIPEEYKNRLVFGVFRPPETLIARKDLFARAYITVEHPPKFVTIHNAKQYSHGLLGDTVDDEVGEDGETYLYTSGTFMDETAAAYYERYRELSCGYEPVVEWETGEYKGRAYQLKLVDIKSVNHVALVRSARGGRQIRVLDCRLGLLEAIRGGEKKMIPFKFIFDASGLRDDVSKIRRAFESAESVEDMAQVNEFLKPYIGKMKACDDKVKLEEYFKDFEGLRDRDKGTFMKCRNHVRDLAVKLWKDSAPEMKDEPSVKDEPPPKDEPSMEEEPPVKAADVDAKINAAMDSMADRFSKLLNEWSAAAGAAAQAAGRETMPLKPAKQAQDGKALTSEGILAMLKGGK
jgi:hypothetical protein